MKIVITRKLFETDIAYINKRLTDLVGGRFELIQPDSYSEEDICKAAVNADILLGSFITKNIVRRSKNLKLIQIPWTGMDTFDFDSVKDCNIPVCNTHSNASAVAEMGVVLTLDLIKKVSYHDRKMRKGDWNRVQSPLGLESKLVSDMNISILGYGNIGKRIGGIFSGFGAKITAVGKRVLDLPEIKSSYKFEEWLVSPNESDVCICTLPLTPDTRNILDKKIFELMRGALFVNVSRAEIFNEQSLYDALVDDVIGGFASDVWWREPKRGEPRTYPSEYSFDKLENVIMSPHRAGYQEGVLPHLDDAIVNIANLIEGRALINRVDVCAGY
jgi:phosphoglycerate dehydrogenase-like enzyme